MVWVIVNKDDPSEFWNNDDGWVNFYSATLFHRDEIRTLHLPFDGEWLPARAVLERVAT